MIGLDHVRRARLAAELGRDLDQDVAAILAKYGLGTPDVDPAAAELFGDPAFQRQVDEAHQSWLRTRVRVQATRAVLDTVPDVVGIVKDPTQPARARVSGVDTLAKVAGLQQEVEAPQAPFSVVINLPGGGAVTAAVDRAVPRVIEASETPPAGWE